MKCTSKNVGLKAKSNALFALLAVLCVCLILCSSIIVLGMPEVSYAAEQKSGIEVVLPNMIEFVPMLVAFILVAIILGKFGWPKFEEMLEKRKNKIESALKDSEEKRQESENLLQDYKKQLSDAQDKADEILKEAKIEGAEISSKLENEAKAKSDAQAEKARLAIEQSKKTAEHEIKTEAVNIAVAAVAKFVSQDMTDDEHRKLIEKYVKEAGNLAG